MAVAQRCARGSAAASRPRTVAVVAKQQQKVSLPQAAATVVASFVLAASPALAGVVLEQPSLKKVFQAEPAAPKPKGEKAVATKKEAPKKKEAVAETSGGGIAPQAVALPAALVVVGGGAFALTTVDAGFGEFMRTAAVKDSATDGAGYETDIKGDGPVGGKKKAVKKTASKSSKSSAPTSPLSSLFGGEK